jgi:hypothetical protein
MSDAAVVDAALTLCDAVLSLHESLRHPKHMQHLEPATAAAQAVITGYFRHQKTALIHWVKYRIGESLREDKTGRRRASEILPDSLSPLSFAVTHAESDAWSSAIADAISKAGAQLADELSLGVEVPQTAMERYLEQNSFSKLTGDLEEVTKQRLRAAVSDAVSSGATVDEIVGAIEATMDNFGTSRAEMIAQTEINNSYNFGRHEIAVAAGFGEKAWITESGNPCVTCEDNEAEGWIPFGQAFSSGDQMPTAHPRCYCSLDFRSVS